MLSYYYHRKGELKACEDSHTALTFDLLKYLPTEIFWQILKKSLLHDKLPYFSGELNSITYWENMSAEGTTNSRHVQPDVFLRFNEFDVIIEAKIDSSSQCDLQKENEIKAYYNDYGTDNKVLYFLQLGGLTSNEDEPDYTEGDIKAIICKTNWSRLLEQIEIEKNTLLKENSPLQNSYVRILEDLIKGYELHQYYIKKWLKDIETTKIRHSSFAAFKYLKCRTIPRKLKKLRTEKITHSHTPKLFSYAKPK